MEGKWGSRTQRGQAGACVHGPVPHVSPRQARPAAVRRLARAAGYSEQMRAGPGPPIAAAPGS
jgi:hypothetical protein